MRSLGIARLAACLTLCVALSLVAAFPLQAQSGPVPEKRLLPEDNVDFYGSDLQSLFDTTYSACVRACIANPGCGAFTFNSRSNSCFPKSNVTQRTPYEGALSAILIPTDPAVLNGAPDRLAELSFLAPKEANQATAFATAIVRRHPPKNWTLEQLEEGLAKAMSEKRWADAVLWAGPAVVLADRPDLWRSYAAAALQAKGKNSGETRDFRQRALSAAINAHLRSVSPGDRAASLQTLARVLEGAKRGRQMIPALRLANDIAPSEQTATALDAAIAKYGFRIEDHQVDSNASVPRVCASFSEPLAKTGVDYAPYVQLPGTSFSVEAQGNQLCVEGITHGERYRLSFRAGLPAASGEALIKDVTLNLYVKDRTAAVRFPGRAYVLPKVGEPALPIIGVNLAEVDLKLYRVSDRNLLRTFQDQYFGRPMAEWEERNFARDIGEAIWEGTGQLQQRLNEDVTTRLPMAEAVADLPAGLYQLTAKVPGADPYEAPAASQWFLISDLGLSTLSGADGLHVFVRSLASAEAKAGLEVTLISRANRVLGTAQTDAQGYAKFDPGLTLGLAGASPALVTVRDGEEDLAFLSLTDPEFDLSDRGVEGREPAGPVDLFLTTDRGAYRTGEVIYATALARDSQSKALGDLPLTAVLTRPDGVEYSRQFSDQGVAGGHVFSLPVAGAAPRGTWTLDLHTDPKAPPVATTQVLVEDFLPERIDFNLALPETPIAPGSEAALTVQASYLFGGPAADLPVEGEVRVVPVSTLDGLPGFQFGRYDDTARAEVSGLPGGRTDDQGIVQVPASFPAIKGVTRPLEARLTVRVSEGSGRPVERRLTQRLAPAGPMIGIKPLFEDVVAEGTEAQFQVIGINPALQPQTMRVKWTLNRVRTRYQWYSQYGQWEWEPTTTRTRVAGGEETLDGPLTLGGPVDWGRYELVVERLDGSGQTASSVDFYAGWYAPAETTTTPDTLELSLDKEAYRPGDTAQLRIVPRYAGKAVITVVSNRLIDMKTVEVGEGETLVDLPVTDDWGAGAYVTAQVIRPMDAPAGRNPARSLGLSYASVDPAKKRLNAALVLPAEAQPRTPLDVTIEVDGIAPGETAYATIAAVDVGILNLTGFETPDPTGHYFGQRKLGMGMRDIYGRLIDGLNGAQGTIRSGGDAVQQMKTQSPPPTEELVAYFSGPVTIGPDGTAQVSFDLPAFNGTVRVMGVVWSDTGIGQTEADVLVRDPVVLTATIPRFLSPGDASQVLVELVHAKGPTGQVKVDIKSDGLAIDATTLPQLVSLAEREKKVFTIPVTARDPGLHSIRVALVTPDGTLLRKELKIPVQINDPEIARTTRLPLAPGATFTLTRDVFEDLRPGSGQVTLALGPLGRFDAPGLLSTLDRYPYGCTEQTTSRALPLLYFDQVATAMGLATRENIQERVDQSIQRILARQASEGGFGLWGVYDGDFWLDAYVTDFLSRARAQGYTVPDRAFQAALDNLRNRLNYAADFDKGGHAEAYALMVLAREGAAAMGDLRYYADVKGRDFATPLATAQLAAALALYGDQARADRLFSLAAEQLVAPPGTADRPVWRSDYGTNLRDAAAVLTLATEAGTQVIDRDELATAITGRPERMSTQEAVWSLMATSALIDASSTGAFLIDGAPSDGPLVRMLEDQTTAQPIAVTNNGPRASFVTLTTFGVPKVPEPAGGTGYAIKREYYTMDGTPANPASVPSGTRLVTVLTVTPFAKGEARLMVNDPLPAGFEIDNPNLLRGGDIRQLDWLKPASTRHAEFRQDRFLAAVDWRSDKPFQLAYIVRAIAPGSYHHPAAHVEDMYRPRFRAHTDAGRVTVTP